MRQTIFNNQIVRKQEKARLRHVFYAIYIYIFKLCTFVVEMFEEKTIEK